jgi:hypothetical protein
MAEVEAPTLPSAIEHSTEPGIETTDTCSVEEHHGEHEASFVMVDTEPLVGESNVPIEEIGNGATKGVLLTSSDDSPEIIDSESAMDDDKKASKSSGVESKAKAPASAKPTAKSNGTPLVKKV